MKEERLNAESDADTYHRKGITAINCPGAIIYHIAYNDLPCDYCFQIRVGTDRVIKWRVGLAGAWNQWEVF